jgi:hypothetical protein
MTLPNDVSRCAGHSPEYRLICDERHGCQRYTDLERFGEGPVLVPVAALMRIVSYGPVSAHSMKQCPFYIEAE